ncbi:CO dehydrogenase/acetyl-CoA synthase complex subunit epsilon [uncultured Methanoregula sp.]|uniref:CO dehydrogenase/acetyl-CoA synthase complex subunit epsilon n=1 Tax=uncultured Methanoregula sp. TaxID=1005933 RepID=UPI002AAB8AB9|nr:CO dehydrogenase/acetyl-CoA synthase complex subunit epsilon [uncultured Methanoregula sp.]
MPMNESWQTAEIPGPKKASLIVKPDIADAMIRRAKRPIMIVGHGIIEYDVEGKKLIDCLIELAKKAKIPVVVTASTNKEFLLRHYTPAAIMPAVDISNRLTDPSWKGLDGKEPYDLAIFVGLPYAMESTILSGLKHFAPGVKTMTLDCLYQPNASWSFPNSTIKDWAANLKGIVMGLGD